MPKKVFADTVRVMVRTVFTPNKAAAHVGVSRSAIMRALASKSLKASRDNRNRWQIELADLEEWAADRPMSANSDRTVSANMSDHDRDQVAEMARLEAENGQLRERLGELREDRDAWRQQAERLASEARPGLIERIFGRR
ncbi:MAG: helix-turn-helix domain-containing protein [Thiotrichales bacterium]|nr:helix-turn-helix domain-containing protein [Thiotrichales bacterium]